MLKQIILTLAAPKPKLKSLSRSLKPTKFSQTPRVKKLTTKLETNSRTNMLVVPKAKEQVHTVTVTKLMKLKQGHMAPNQGKAQAAISPKATRESPSTTCSQVPFREEIKILILSQQYPNPNIELSLMNQQRSFDVLLNDESVKFYFFEILVI